MRKNLTNTVLGGAVLAYLLIGGALSRHFPPVNIDEVAASVTSFNFIHGNGMRNSLLDDVQPEGVPRQPKNWNGRRVLYTAWVGAWMAVLPFGWWSARVASLAAGLGLLLFLAAIGRRIGGPRLGHAMTGLLLLQPLLWMASTVVNELIIAAFAAAGLAWFALTPRAESDWGLFSFGLLSPLLVLIHPFGVGLAAALVVFRVSLMQRREKPALAKISAGLVAGAFLMILGEPFPQNKTSLYFQIARPPILALTSVGAWARQIQGFFLQPTTFYYPGAEPHAGVFARSLIAMWGALALAVFSLALAPASDGREKRVRRSFLLALPIAVVSLIALSARFEAFYFALLLPFALPVIGIGLLAAAASSRVAPKVFAILSAGLLMLSAGAFSRFVARYSSSYIDHREIASRLKTMAGHPARIMAPNVFWFDFPQSDFRDASTLVVSRYFTEGRFEPQNWLRSWHPDVLVVDPSLMRVLGHSPNPLQALSDLLKIPIDYVGPIETGRSYGTLQVLALHWPADVPKGVPVPPTER